MRKNLFLKKLFFWRKVKKIIFVILLTIIYFFDVFAARIIEALDRGVIAVWLGNNRVWISWRMFATDPDDISFNVYRGNTKINSTPITNVTYFIDTSGTQTSLYHIRAIINGQEVETSKSVIPWSTFYKRINLQRPPNGTTPDGVSYSYSPNDASVGDLDGDGEYEIVLKWDPSNSKDNSQSGYTGNVYIDAYKLDGTFMWRIDLGINIRAGAHYTQFLVYDFDCDGKAEMICKTAPGTKDGTGRYLNTGPAANDNDTADYRNASGYILSGPEYLTVFRGIDGKEIITVNYEPPRGNVSSWGDSYGNRVDRFLACVAYLDGTKPYAIFQRGYYTRMTLAAWEFTGTSLVLKWFFDSNSSGNSSAAGQGNHNLSVGDIDNDGKDEIVQGACAIDDNGRLMYATGLGHGDAMHLGDLDPSRDGLEVWAVHESASASYGYELHDARTGQIIWGAYTGSDVGRGLAADIDSRYRGYEMWSTGASGVFTCKGTQISTSRPSVNFRIYWDGDLLDELLDGTIIDKWNGNGTTRLLTAYNYGAAANNGTKNTPCLVADILGDWREEVIWRTNDDTGLLIFTTTSETDFRMYTLMHDPQYRLSIAWQNVAYNQPPHLGFYLYDRNPPKPNVTYPTTVTQYVLAINVSPQGAGTVNLSPAGGVYTAGTQVTLTAVANSGYIFDRWSGDITGTQNPVTIVMNSTKTVVCNFKTQTYTLAINVSPQGAGTVNLSPAGGVYTAGTQVTLTAVANSGYIFDRWSGDITGTTNPATIVMDSNKSVTASFVHSSYSIVISVLPNSFVGNIIRQPDNDYYFHGSTLVLTAQGVDGYKFASWSGSVISTINPLSVVVYSSMSIEGIFVSSGCEIINVDRVWINRPIGNHTSKFELSFNAIPLGNFIDCPIGLSSYTASGYTDLACIVRFNSNGVIDVRDGNGYRNDINLSYSRFVS